jgi:hypothetical protein
VPIRIVPDSPAAPGFAMSTLSEPVVRLAPAPEPIATLRLPLVLLRSALKPAATLLLPVVLDCRAPNPDATLLLPLAFENECYAAWPTGLN